jgi:hypothetical protein
MELNIWQSPQLNSNPGLIVSSSAGMPSSWSDEVRAAYVSRRRTLAPGISGCLRRDRRPRRSFAVPHGLGKRCLSAAVLLLTVEP